MAEREWKLFVKDIHRCTVKIMSYVQTKDVNAFVNDEKTYDAVLRNLEIIGEAVKKIPNPVRRQNTTRCPGKKSPGCAMLLSTIILG